jgi:hypothetical protein
MVFGWFRKSPSIPLFQRGKSSPLLKMVEVEALLEKGEIHPP